MVTDYYAPLMFNIPLSFISFDNLEGRRILYTSGEPFHSLETLLKVCGHTYLKCIPDINKNCRAILATDKCR